MSDHLYMIFESMSHVLAAERAARKEGISCRMVPIPRNMSTDCGMCVSVRADEGPAFLEIIEKKGLKPTKIEEHKGPEPGSRCYSS